ncbi:hypothetical protein LTR85_004099 [Meristemomyces frigidus]|nr:hypothetical protein LTR85_004099 [Meristemomyces frigidus]
MPRMRGFWVRHAKQPSLARDPRNLGKFFNKRIQASFPEIGWWAVEEKAKRQLV